MNQINVWLGVFMCLLLSACQQSTSENSTITSEPVKVTHIPGALPDWAKNAAIYEVNVRQYTPEGTFNAFAENLPRLKEMGIDLLWLMPIHPISMTNRKATPDIMIEEVKDVEEKKKYLGSPYSVSDYRAINPEFGTMADFKSMLKKSHDLGIKVIIDWVPNHTGWDHQWLKNHKDWYTLDEKGEVIKSPTLKGNPTDWYDTAELNFDNQDMRKAMIADMLFWVNEVGIDGFRFDVAHDVPNDFWKTATDALYKAAPVFLLAEAQEASQMNDGYFHADYGWNIHHLLNGIAKGDHKASDIDEWYAQDAKDFQKGFHMQFTSNHDENTWAGTVFDRMGDGHKAFAVLAATFNGMPLVYSGQEAANKKRLEFFEKDNIDWGTYEYAGFYKTLFDLKENNKALWNGKYGGPLVKIPTGKDDAIYAFTREKDDDKVLVIINLSKDVQDFALNCKNCAGTYNNVLGNGEMEIKAGQKMSMAGWEYLVLSN